MFQLVTMDTLYSLEMYVTSYNINGKHSKYVRKFVKCHHVNTCTRNPGKKVPAKKFPGKKFSSKKSPGKKGRRKKWPTIFRATKHNRIAYNNMNSNFSSTPIIYVKIFLRLLDCYWCEKNVFSEVFKYKMCSKSVTTTLKWPMANFQWSPPGLDYWIVWI